MTHACYVLGAWGVSIAACGLYAAILIVRGRSLRRQMERHQPTPQQ